MPDERIAMERLAGQVRGKKLFLLDIDGTISFDATPIDGTLDFCRRVREIGGKYIFITNNSTMGNADYVKKFLKMGIDVDESSFITATTATVRYLREHHADDRIFVLGTKSLIAELRKQGFSVTEDVEPGIDLVVAAFDNELTYEKLKRACELLETRTLPFIATNPDLVCPVGFGYVPDCGSICQMLTTATGKEPVYVGKPNPIIVEMALDATGYSLADTLVIGDRLYTDIAVGNNAGADTLVVFTGEAKMEDLAETEFPPTYYTETIRGLYEALL